VEITFVGLSTILTEYKSIKDYVCAA